MIGWLMRRLVVAVFVAAILGGVGSPAARSADYVGGPMDCSVVFGCKVVRDPHVFLIIWKPIGWLNGTPGYETDKVEQFLRDLNQSTFSNIIAQYGSQFGLKLKVWDTITYQDTCTVTT